MGMGIRVGIAGAHDLLAAGVRAVLGQDSEFEVLDQYPHFGDTPDVVLYDAAAMEADGGAELLQLTKEPHPPVLVIGRPLRPDLAARAQAHGAVGQVSMEAPCQAVMAAIRRAAGDGALLWGRDATAPALGEEAGLTAREAEILSGICGGLSNAEISTLHDLSINTVKSYIRAAYRKIGVSTRSQAVAWALQHGFEPPPATDTTWSLDRARG
jgi:DNA-binding NarL/FixJ family response regulator